MTFINNIDIVISAIPKILRKFVFSLKITEAMTADNMRLLPNFSGYISTVLSICVLVSVVKYVLKNKNAGSKTNVYKKISTALNCKKPTY